MEALTGARRRKQSQPSFHGGPSSGGKEFIPELYRSVGNKRFCAEQPATEEERTEIRELPSDTEAALLHLRASFHTEVFQGRLPPVFLYSQLGSILTSRFIIDSQLTKLAKENKILTFSTFTSSNYLIVFLQDFLRIKREGIFQRFASQVLTTLDTDDQGVSTSSGGSQGEPSTVIASLENSRYFSKESLRKRWKFEEDEIRQLVNAGFLGVQEGGFYCISLPGAGEFIKTYEKGKKAVSNAIKRAKFGDILQAELEQRPMKKSVPLGVMYHIHDLIGSGEVDKVETTSGPMLRLRRKI